MQQSQSIRAATALIVAAGFALISACSTAATAGDEMLRAASFGRVQATPFMDTIDTRDCREALDATYGFPRESRAMKNGVFVVQTYDCRARRVVAQVSLNNFTDHPMTCSAETEAGREGATIAPGSLGFFEYSFAVQTYSDVSCAHAN